MRVDQISKTSDRHASTAHEPENRNFDVETIRTVKLESLRDCVGVCGPSTFHGAIATRAKPIQEQRDGVCSGNASG